jgi:predicted neutral ceramidase superfamily lipid hydrolase
MSDIFYNLISLVFLVGLISLQIYLSKKENKWLGLILPAINVIYSIFIILGTAFSANLTIVQIIIQALMSFLLCNTSTMILIVIYFVYREKIKRNKRNDEINAQDLQ